MRVAFLDIDGVFNSTRMFASLADLDLKAKRERICGYPWDLEKGLCPMFDPVAVNIFRRAVECFDLKIVLSSSWRHGLDIKYLIKSFEEYYDWPDAPVIDKTVGRKRSECRGDVIQMWLDEHPDVVDFIIVDDSIDMTEEQINNGNFFRVDAQLGLSYDFLAYLEKRWMDEEGLWSRQIRGHEEWQMSQRAKKKYGEI